MPAGKGSGNYESIEIFSDDLDDLNVDRFRCATCSQLRHNQKQFLLLSAIVLNLSTIAFQSMSNQTWGETMP